MFINFAFHVYCMMRVWSVRLSQATINRLHSIDSPQLKVRKAIEALVENESKSEVVQAEA